MKLSASQINDAAKLMADGMSQQDAYRLAAAYGESGMNPWLRDIGAALTLIALCVLFFAGLGYVADWLS